MRAQKEKRLLVIELNTNFGVDTLALELVLTVFSYDR